MTTLLQRLLDLAARRESVIQHLTLPDAIEMARQDVADIREAVERLQRGMES